MEGAPARWLHRAARPLTARRRRVRPGESLAAPTDRAWEEARDDYERAIAAHYVAHLATEPEAAHRWNLLALEHARLDGRAARFMGSLLVCLGDSFERLGDVARAERYFAEAARHGVEHSRR